MQRAKTELGVSDDATMFNSCTAAGLTLITFYKKYDRFIRQRFKFYFLQLP
jgi:hypothetical protein